jgi:hypothetical protein
MIPARPILAKEQYKMRYDRQCAQLHFNMCKEIEAELDNEQWYKHVPKSAETGQEDKVTKLRNQQVQTNRTDPNDKPDIMIHDNEK